MICWYCHWGWAESVADIYLEAVEKLGGCEWPLHFGPAHIVWEDENWGHVDWALEHFEEYKGDNWDSDLAVIRWSLEELKKIPLEQREIEPEDYDGENPAMFPPPVGIKTKKV